MRAVRFGISLLLHLVVTLMVVNCAVAGPLVAFQPGTMSVTAAGTFRTPAITITNATGVSMVSLSVTLPEGVSISTSTDVSSGNLLCVTQGSGVSGAFFSEWKAAEKRIFIVCAVNPGATIEVVRSIQFSTAADIASSELTLSGSVTGGSGAALFGSLAIVPPHTVSISSLAVSPTEVASAGTTSCSMTAVDSGGHGIIYQWSDGGRGGTFSPNANSQNPTYTAPANTSGATVTYPLRCNVSCVQNTGVTATRTADISIRAVPPKAIQITSTPNAGASIAFTPATDLTAKSSPKVTPVSLSYLETATGITLTAAKQDGAARPLWFDHWTVDGVDKPQGQLSVSLNVSGNNHTLCAVYGRTVGDLNSDGRVDKADSQMVLSALLGDTATTSEMDVDMSGVVDINDARWILLHRS